MFAHHRVSKCYWFLMVYAPAVIIFWPIAILVQAYRMVVEKGKRILK